LKNPGALIKDQNLPVSIVQSGSMFTIFFRKNPPSNFQHAKECDTKKYAKFFWHLLDHGIYMAPSQFETNFVGLSHTERDLESASVAICDAIEAAAAQV
jgi:glutamate-1-semialdehyde 2,1-aminomutase